MGRTTTKRRAALRILGVPHEDEWAPKRHLPRALVPVERSTAPCATCPSHCCFGVVHLTLVEAARIALSLSLPMESFVRAVPIDKARTFEPSSPVRLEEGLVRIALQWNGETHRCTFLHDVGEARRCSIHPLRPGVCRQYPFKLQRRGRGVAVGTEVFCPTKWLWNEEILAAQERHLDRWLEDRALDRRLASRWNDVEREDRGLGALCRFAVAEVHRLEGLGDPELLYPQPRRRLGER